MDYKLWEDCIEYIRELVKEAENNELLHKIDAATNFKYCPDDELPF